MPSGRQVGRGDPAEAHAAAGAEPSSRVSEPMTMATDYLLAGVATVLALLLLMPASGAASVARQTWGAAFLVIAAAAVAGGTFHGFSARLKPLLLHRLWYGTLLLSTLAGFLLLVAAGLGAEHAGLRVAVALVGALKLALACLFLWRTGAFAVVVYDSGASLMLVLALTLWSIGARTAGAEAGWLVAGVLVSLAGGLLQAAKRPLARHLSHNDLFHLVQVVGCYLLYRGALHA